MKVNSTSFQLHELSLACLSMFVQLFGGDHPDTMNAENMASVAQTLTRSTPKRQKILLKVCHSLICG